jgi:hypothetical protein
MFSREEKRDEIEKIINNTRTWLASHGHGSKNPWPQHEIDIKQRRLEVMKEIRQDIEIAIERANQRGAA